MTANDLRRLRQALGLTQAELARRWGVAAGSVRNWEQRRAPIPTWLTSRLRSEGWTPCKLAALPSVDPPRRGRHWPEPRPRPAQEG